MRGLVLLCLFAGCGRFNFDARGDGGGGQGTGDGSADGALPPGVTYERLKASNADMGDELGLAIALSRDGSTLAVGAYREASSAGGIDGKQDDNSAARAGAVYVYVKQGSAWIQQAYVKASNTGGGDEFGVALALSADGNTLAVGAVSEASALQGVGAGQTDNSALNAGAVYVFTRSGTLWSQQEYIKASNAGLNDNFGGTLDLSDDGDTLAVGAPAEASNATGIDSGGGADNSLFAAGAAYVFTRAGSTWTERAYIKAQVTDGMDNFGFSVSLDSLGDTLAVSAVGEASNATGVGGDTANDSLGFAGAAYVFTRAGVTWSQQAYLKASNPDANDFFGTTLELSGDGATLVVGAPPESSDGIDPSANTLAASGAVYTFTRSPTWTAAGMLKAPNLDAGDYFGSALSLSSDGSVLCVGAHEESSNAVLLDGDQTSNSSMDSGAAYTFTRVGSAWNLDHYIKASNPEPVDAFGISVSLAGDGHTVAISASGEASSATGGASDNSMPDSGAVYVITLP